MAINLTNQKHLDELTSTLNQTLIETGRFFRSGGSLQSRAQLKRSIPAAHEKFQFALDNLSEQIFIAKAFLERDYEVVKARKAALRPVEDVAMGESNAQEGPETVPPSEQATANTDHKESDANPTRDDVTVKMQTEVESSQQNLPDQSSKEDKTEQTNTVPPPDQTLSGAEELNFDSMLNDNGGPNEFDLNLDFGDDNDIGNENFLSGASFGNSFEGGNQQTENTTSGLPTAAINIPPGGDAFDLELQRAQEFNPDGQLDGTLGPGMDDVMVPTESNFDDLFMESDNMGGDGLDGDGLMQINELDDSWFT